MVNEQVSLLRPMQSFLIRIDRLNWERLLGTLLVLVSLFSLFYNLELSPRIWHDEGGTMLLARAFAEDGIYYIPNSDEHHSFGTVQSVGPTVVLPVALSFKLFGGGILQGRLVAVLLTCFTLLAMYKLTNRLFGSVPSILGLFILLGSTSAQFLYFGRQTLGEVPALGLFLAGWFHWLKARQSNSRNLFVVAGLLIGLAMVTKSSYFTLVMAMFVGLGILDLVYYRRKYWQSLLVVAGFSTGMYLLWVMIQRLYFGNEVFAENAQILTQLREATTGFSLVNMYVQAQFLIGSKNDFFYFLWGLPALVFMLVMSFQKDERGFITCALLMFSGLWLAYYFYSVPWPSYLIAPASIISLFLGKFWYDLIIAIRLFAVSAFQGGDGRRPVAVGLLASCFLALILFVLYPLQNALQFNVFLRDDSPFQLAEFLNHTVPTGATIETWERELGILTDHRYHFPDQSQLINVHAAKYRGVANQFLGFEYFEKARPSYLVIGRFAREFPVYDMQFLATNTTMIARYGIDELTLYEVYEIRYPLAP